MNLLEQKTPGSCDPELTSIKDQTEQLAELSTKTKYLREIVLEESDSRERLDLIPLIRDSVETARARHAELIIEMDLPTEIVVQTDPRLKRAVGELIENSVEHNDQDETKVLVGVRNLPGSTVELTVQDNGPGMPEMEREVLEEGLETPMFHSEGLGLWIVRTIVINIDGQLRVSRNEPRGTIVTLSLPQEE